MATSDNGSAFLTKFEEREGEGLCLNIWLMFKASLYVEITANLILLDMLYVILKIRGKRECTRTCCAFPRFHWSLLQQLVELARVF